MLHWQGTCTEWEGSSTPIWIEFYIHNVFWDTSISWKMCTADTSAGDRGFPKPTPSQPGGVEKPAVEAGPWHQAWWVTLRASISQCLPEKENSRMGHTVGQILIGFIVSLRNRQIKGQAALTGTENDHGSVRILKPGRFWEAKGPLREQGQGARHWTAVSTRSLTCTKKVTPLTARCLIYWAARRKCYSR